MATLSKPFAQQLMHMKLQERYARTVYDKLHFHGASSCSMRTDLSPSKLVFTPFTQFLIGDLIHDVHDPGLTAGMTQTNKWLGHGGLPSSIRKLETWDSAGARRGRMGDIWCTALRFLCFLCFPMFPNVLVSFPNLVIFPNWIHQMQMPKFLSKSSALQV